MSTPRAGGSGDLLSPPREQSKQIGRGAKEEARNADDPARFPTRNVRFSSSVLRHFVLLFPLLGPCDPAAGRMTKSGERSPIPTRKDPRRGQTWVVGGRTSGKDGTTRARAGGMTDRRRWSRGCPTAAIVVTESEERFDAELAAACPGRSLVGRSGCSRARPLDVVAALETVLADAIAKAEPAVVAIAREKSDNDETLAVRGRDAARNPVSERRFLNGRIVAEEGLFGPDLLLSSDVGSGVVVGARGQILTTYHMVRGARRCSFARRDVRNLKPRSLPPIRAATSR